MPAQTIQQITTTLGHYAHLLAEKNLLDSFLPGSTMQETPLTNTAHSPFSDSAAPTSTADQNPAAELPISYVSCDSRDIEPHTLFICKGAAFKAAYLAQAQEAGAVAYVAEAPFEDPDTPDSVRALPCLVVNNIRGALGVLADAAWDHPSGKLNIVAFTGTKGKTTSAWCLRSILDERARRLGLPRTPLFSSVLLDDGVTAGPATLTTPEPLDLERHLANAVSTGADTLVMEASSQALKYGRMIGVDLGVAAFTNISEDHISPIEHPTFEDYFSSKLLIFKQARTAIINLDIQPDLLARINDACQTCQNVITFAMNNPEADVRATNVVHQRGSLSFTLTISNAALSDGSIESSQEGSVELPVVLSMPGDYNVENALGAVACALTLGATAEDIKAGLSHVQVPGRMQNICSTPELVVLVDFAHNGRSMEVLLETVHQAYPNYTVTVVFGATGTKGTDRRYGMGKAAGKDADHIVITTDDPGMEDPADIAAAIDQSARQAAQETNRAPLIETILDRTEAIEHALSNAVQAETPEVVILTGKGTEDYMILGTRHVPYRGDIAIAQDTLTRLGVAY